MDKIIKSPFGDIKFVGVLLTQEFPSTAVFSNDNDEPIIVEWIDLDENNNDIFYIYKTNVNNLTEFVKKDLSHLDLIHGAQWLEYYTFQNSIFDNAKFEKIDFANLNHDALPVWNCYFESYYSPDVKEVIDYFKIIIEKKIDGLGNYYGSLNVKKEDDKFYSGVSCQVNNTKWREISEELYNMLLDLNENN